MQNCAANLLKKYPTLQSSLVGHKAEHSLEVQLPFLQFAVQNLKILPIVMGDQKRKYCEGLGAALAEVANDHEMFLVASSDLSHYYSSDVARKLDAVAIASIQELEIRGIDVGFGSRPNRSMRRRAYRGGVVRCEESRS